MAHAAGDTGWVAWTNGVDALTAAHTADLAGKLDSTVASSTYARRAEFNVRTYGAVGDGVADDTLAIQAAVDASIGGTPAGGVSTARSCLGPVVLPSGSYVITAPIKIYSVDGFHLTGVGEESKLVVSGALTNALDINGSYFGIFQDFTVMGKTGGDTVTSAISLDWTSAVSQRSSSGNTFRRVNVRNLVYVNAFGIGLNTGSYQCDDTTYHHCNVGGAWTAGNTTTYQKAFAVGSHTFGNILSHNFYACESNGNRYGWYIDNIVGFGIFGAVVGNSETDFYLGIVGGANKIESVRSENSTRFIETSILSANASMKVSNVQFESTFAAADGELVRWGYAGTLILDNYCVGLGVPNPVIKNTCYVAEVASIIVRGGASLTAGPSLVVATNPNAFFIAHLDGYSQVDSSFQTIATYPGLIYDKTRTLAVIGVDGTNRTASGLTAARPTMAAVDIGAQWFDTTLVKPIWWNGTVWKDAAGTTV